MLRLVSNGRELYHAGGLFTELMIELALVCVSQKSGNCLVHFNVRNRIQYMYVKSKLKAISLNASE